MDPGADIKTCVDFEDVLVFTHRSGIVADLITTGCLENAVMPCEGVEAKMGSVSFK